MNVEFRKIRSYMSRLSALSLLIVSLATDAQTLNQATTAQLAADEDFEPCALLLGGDDPLTVLTGSLATICDRTVGQSGSPSSSSGGGFAAAPPSVPAVVEVRLEDKEVSGEAPPRGFFLTAGSDSVDRNVTPFEDGYQSDISRIAIGFDRGFGDSKVFGVAVDAYEQDGDFVDGGDFEISNVAVTGFGSVFLGENSSINFYLGFADQENERRRRATFTEITGEGDFVDEFSRTGSPSADFDAEQLSAGLQFAHDWRLDNFTIGPRVGFDWRSTDFDTYDEIDDSGLQLRFYDDEETSSQAFAGLAGSVALSTGFGVVLIEESILYRYESDQDQRSVQVSFVEDTRARRFSFLTEKPNRSFLEYSVGATFILAGGWQVFGEYRGITSHAYIDASAVAFGFRKEI